MHPVCCKIGRSFLQVEPEVGHQGIGGTEFQDGFILQADGSDAKVIGIGIYLVF